MYALTLLQIVPGTGVLAMILNIVLPLLVGPAAVYLFTELSKLVLKTQNWSAFAKRVLVFAWGTVIVGLEHALKISLPEAWGALSQPDIQLLITSALTYLAHEYLNNPAPVAARGR